VNTDALLSTVLRSVANKLDRDRFALGEEQGLPNTDLSTAIVMRPAVCSFGELRQ